MSCSEITRFDKTPGRFPARELDLPMRYDAVALGELLIDFTRVGADADGYPTMAAHPGGAPANFLATMAKFGASTALLGQVGDDAFGQMLLETLRRSHIDPTGIVVDPHAFTTLAFVTLDQSGDRAFSFARKPGADTRLSFEELDRSILDRTRVFHFGTLSLTDEPARTATRQAVAYARGKGTLVSFDPNLRRMLWSDLARAREEMLWGLTQADIVKLSEEEFSFLLGQMSYEEGTQYLLKEYDIKLLFLTLGASGCIFASASAFGRVGPLTGITPVDTTGAGDIFGGSALWKLLQTGKAPQALCAAELEEIARFACTAAGLSTTRPGGLSSVPSLPAVLEQLEHIGAP